LWPGGFIEPRQDAGDFIGMLRIEFAPVVVFEKAFQAAMSKLPDHEDLYSDNCYLSMVNFCRGQETSENPLLWAGGVAGQYSEESVIRR
jgi:hypothetical protein